MRFVPSNRLLWVTALVVIPTISIAVFDQDLLRTIALLTIVILIVICLVDLQISIKQLTQVDISMPDILRCTKGRQVQLPIQISNQSRTLPWIRCGLPTTAEWRIVDHISLTIQPLLVGKTTPAVFTIEALQRGQWFINSFHIEAPSLLKLWLVRRDYQMDLEVRAYPNLSGERKRLSSLFLMRGLNGAQSIRQIGKGREFEQLRDYQSGDDYIDIDWKATARRHTPVTRTYQIERTQEVYVIVDHSRFSGRKIRVPITAQSEGDWLYREDSAGGEFLVTTQLERFLHCSLVLANVAERQGDQFGFISFADKVDRFIRSRNGKQHYNVIRDALYTLEPSTVAPDYQQLMVSLRQNLSRRALIIMLVDLSDPHTAEQFYEALPLINRQHLILVNMVRPEQAHPLFTAGELPKGVNEIYEKLAGHFQWQDLRETSKKLAHLGVELGLPAHEELCTEAVTQYLKVKRRQLI